MPLPLNELCQLAAGCVLAVSSWAAPQPAHTYGLGVVYGNQALVEANAAVRGYDLSPYPDRCGVSGISPAMLGRVVWLRAPLATTWQAGPCLVIDAVARVHAYDSIYLRQEVVEVSRDVAAVLGFEYDGPVVAFFGACPPPADSLYQLPSPYAPPLRLEEVGSPGKSFWPYAEQELPQDC